MMKTFNVLKELIRLRRENRELRRRLAGNGEMNTVSDGGQSCEQFFYTSSYINADYSNYFSYLVSRIKRSRPGRLVKSISGYSRKYFIFTRILRYSLYVWRVIDASAAVVISVLLFAIFLPIVLIAAFFVLAVSLFGSRAQNRRILRELDGTVTILFAQGDQLCHDSFFAGVAREAARAGTVFVVSPLFFGTRGLTKKRFYICARKEENGIWILRRHYFYYIMRTLLSQHEGKIRILR